MRVVGAFLRLPIGFLCLLTLSEAEGGPVDLAAQVLPTSESSTSPTSTSSRASSPPFGVFSSEFRPNFDGPVFAMADFEAEIYVGGQFLSGGSGSVSCVARWDGETWRDVERGIGLWFPEIGPQVNALAVFNGSLYGAGSFVQIGDLGSNNIARWDGTRWSPLSGGITAPATPCVFALHPHGGYLYVGGDLTMVGGYPNGIPALGIARWDGSIWSAVGKGVNAPVYALTTYEDSLYAGGLFTTAGSGLASHVAKWNGSQWSSLGGGTNGAVRALAVYGGCLYAGGEFTTAGGTPADHIARWDGTDWTPVSYGVNGAVYALTEYDGKLYVGGSFTAAGGEAVGYIASWDGVTWSSVGSGVDHSVRVLHESGGVLLAGGKFTRAGDVSANAVAVWDGSHWSAITEGFDRNVLSLTQHGGSLYAGGLFSTAGTVSANRVARWNGTSWEPLSAGVGGPLDPVHEREEAWVNTAISYDDVLYVGGHFTQAGGQPAANIAKWDGSEWTTGATTMDGDVMAFAVLDTLLYVGGRFRTIDGSLVNRVACWDGMAWSGLSSGMDGNVYALAVHEGALYAGGAFQHAGGVVANGIARWNGSDWSHMGSGVVGEVRTMGTFSGDLVVGGAFTEISDVPARNIARWGGTRWYPLSGGLNGTVRALSVYNGTLFVGGSFLWADQLFTPSIARWDGAFWNAVSTGMDGSTTDVLALTACESSLYAAGMFTIAGGLPSGFMARWEEDDQTSVFVIHYSAAWRDGCAQIRWRLASSGSSITFTVLRRSGSDPYAVLEGATVIREGDDYLYCDQDATEGESCWYKVLVKAGREDLELFEVKLPRVALRTKLYENYPNPFTPSTTIRFELSQASMIDLSIYDVTGRLVTTLLRETASVGFHEVPLRSEDFAAGVYFCTLRVAHQRFTQKLVLVR